MTRAVQEQAELDVGVEQMPFANPCNGCQEYTNGCAGCPGAGQSLVVRVAYASQIRAWRARMRTARTYAYIQRVAARGWATHDEPIL